MDPARLPFSSRIASHMPMPLGVESTWVVSTPRVESSSHTSRPMPLSSTMLANCTGSPSRVKFSATFRDTPPATTWTSPTLRSSGL